MNLDAVSGFTSTLSGANASAARSEEGGQDRFLRMLVAQMQNQDPLNPMDNAEVTSQMAQINTVAGIEKLNKSLGAMLSQLSQGQAMQGAALVGRDVLVPGQSLHLSGGVARGGFDLSAPADRVSVEVMDSSGRTLERFELGAMEAGRQHFFWQADGAAADGAKLSYRVTALSGNTAVPLTTYTRDTVGAVSANNGRLDLDLMGGGTVAYDLVRAVV